MPVSVKQSSGAAALLLSVYIFMLYSRVFEATALIGVRNLYLMLTLSVIALLTVCLKGDVLRAAKSTAGIMLIAFTLWAILILPFSTWKSESLRELAGTWVKSVAVFFIIVGLTSKFTDSKRAFSAVGYGAAISAVVLMLTEHYSQGRVTSFGSLANANEVAFHIAFGLPFLVLLISRVRILYKLPLAAAVLLSLVLLVKTASRAGLIITAVMIGMALVKLSFSNKLKVLGISLVALMVGLATVNREQLERYKTIFSSDSSSAEAQSAKESGEGRKHKLEQSIELTLTHPLFGVGMGAFIPAAAELSKERGEHQDWLASHNSYTQVSSETGLIGLMLMLGVFAVSLMGLARLDRKARRLGLKDLRSMTICMLLSSIALAIHFFFDAIAYEYYLPMVAGLCSSLIYAAQSQIAAAQAQREGDETGGTDSARGSLTSMATAQARSVRPGPANGSHRFSEPGTKSKKAVQVSNRYRFGRPRKSRVT